MNTKIPIATSDYQGLKEPVSKYNQWQYRTADANLSQSSFEMAMSDLPIFCNQFLETLPSLRKSLSPQLVDALRMLNTDEFGFQAKKIMESLEK